MTTDTIVVAAHARTADVVLSTAARFAARLSARLVVAQVDDSRVPADPVDGSGSGSGSGGASTAPSPQTNTTTRPSTHPPSRLRQPGSAPTCRSRSEADQPGPPSGLTTKDDA